jgi:hypothetical protein
MNGGQGAHQVGRGAFFPREEGGKERVVVRKDPPSLTG